MLLAAGASVDVVWHAHDAEDERFLVQYGTLSIQLAGDREWCCGGDHGGCSTKSL